MMHKRNNQLLLAFILLGFALRIAYLDRQSIWFDESLSVLFATLPLRDGIEAMLTEGLQHSPLFYLLLRPFLADGFSEFALRFPSVVFGVLTIPLVYRCGLELHHRNTGLLAAFLVTINPYHIWYSQEGRMYALLGAVAVGSFLFFIRLLQQPNAFNLVGLSIISAIGFNTHHFAFLLPFTQFAYLIITFRDNILKLRWWALTQFIAGISFIPWILLVIQRQSLYGTSGTRKTASLLDPFYTFWNFSIAYSANLHLVTALILLVYTGLLILGSWHGKKLLVLWLILPFLITFLASQKFPTYVDRYLIISFAPFVLLIALGLVKSPKFLHSLLFSVLLITSVMGIGRIYFDDSIHQRTDWRGLAEYLRENTTTDDLILVQFFQDTIPLHFYKTGPATIKPIITLDSLALPTEEIQTSQRIWFIVAYYSHKAEHSLVGPCNYSITNIDKFAVQIKEWQANRNLLHQIDFNCVRLYLYEP